MKKILLTAVILVFAAGLANAQFVAGTKYVGGSISYWMDMTDYGDGFGMLKSQMNLTPAFGYFAMDDLLVMASLGYTKVGYTDDYKDLMDVDDPDATTSFAVGAKYFINYLYVGASYMSTKMGDADADNALLFEGGYLYPITEYFFVDLGIDYAFGLTEYGMDPNTYKNKSLTAGIGFATFF